jgi:predicted RNase H-like HicB family nuclease
MLCHEPEGGEGMDFYTTVLRMSGSYWVSLCLENGLVGQGTSKEEAVAKLKEAIESFEDVRRDEADLTVAPVSIRDLHEFLKVEDKLSQEEGYELRAVYA